MLIPSTNLLFENMADSVDFNLNESGKTDIPETLSNNDQNDEFNGLLNESMNFEDKILEFDSGNLKNKSFFDKIHRLKLKSKDPLELIDFFQPIFNKNSNIEKIADSIENQPFVSNGLSNKIQEKTIKIETIDKKNLYENNYFTDLTQSKKFIESKLENHNPLKDKKISFDNNILDLMQLNSTEMDINHKEIDSFNKVKELIMDPIKKGEISGEELVNISKETNTLLSLKQISNETKLNYEDEKVHNLINNNIKKNIIDFNRNDSGDYKINYIEQKKSDFEKTLLLDNNKNPKIEIDTKEFKKSLPEDNNEEILFVKKEYNNNNLDSTKNRDESDKNDKDLEEKSSDFQEHSISIDNNNIKSSSLITKENSKEINLTERIKDSIINAPETMANVGKARMSIKTENGANVKIEMQIDNAKNLKIKIETNDSEVKEAIESSKEEIRISLNKKNIQIKDFVISENNIIQEVSDVNKQFNSGNQGFNKENNNSFNSNNNQNANQERRDFNDEFLNSNFINVNKTIKKNLIPQVEIHRTGKSINLRA